MKYVTIRENYVGLVYRDGTCKKLLHAGSHWVSVWDEITTYNMSFQFVPHLELNILLKNQFIVDSLIIIDVSENEIALLYKDKIFAQVLVAGKYAYWKGAVEFTYIKANLSNIEIESNIDKNLLERASLSAYIRTAKVEIYEKALLYIDGKMNRILEAGNYYWWKNNTQIHVTKTDMRQVSLEIVGQEILTKDKAQLRLNFSLRYKVVDIVKALAENKEFEKQLYVLVQLILRQLIGKLSFDELLDNKDKIADEAMIHAVDKAKEIGIEIISGGIKDIVLPGDVKEIMNNVLIAEKRAQANIIMRREETASTRSLLNTAKLMEDNAMLFKLKEMEYVEKIAEKINTISVSGGGQIIDQLKQMFIK